MGVVFLLNNLGGISGFILVNGFHRLIDLAQIFANLQCQMIADTLAMLTLTSEQGLVQLADITTEMLIGADFNGALDHIVDQCLVNLQTNYPFWWLIAIGLTQLTLINR